MSIESSPLELRAVQAETLFQVTPSGRLLHGNSPDLPEAPRMWIAGSTPGNVVRFRADVSEKTARAIEALALQEPPLTDAEALLVHLREYVNLLRSDDNDLGDVSRDLSWVFPSAPDEECDTVDADVSAVQLVYSDTPEGGQLLTRLRTSGMPNSLIEMGFASTDDFWPPWCAVLNADVVVSLAITARLSPRGAEVGIVTPEPFRRQGFAALATRGWWSVDVLRGRSLFYSTDEKNIASQRVAERLRLSFLGPSVSIH